ncbi:MAG: carbon-nitrogen hydrolase family protein [Proteobacteria bacterium]|nr:carbon-nitrogen hydrolase family protein [Pseudomonadota bacterium]
MTSPQILYQDLSIAVCSLTATSDKNENLKNALLQITEAATRGADWIFLPEMFSFHGPYDQLFLNAEDENGLINQTLSELSARLGKVVFAGSVGERPQGAKDGKIFNTQYVFDRMGQIVAKYRKIHLFNLLGADGRPLYCESDGYLSGDQLKTFEIDGWRVGLATCYDVRFPEMFTGLTKNGPLDLIAIPAAFTLLTGTYHWELLCRARAVENLCYVAAANQVGHHSPGKASFGHGIIIDPWGNVAADTGNRPGVAIAKISKESIQYWRAQLPVLNNRRPEIYVT